MLKRITSLPKVVFVQTHEGLYKESVSLFYKVNLGKTGLPYGGVMWQF